MFYRRPVRADVGGQQPTKSVNIMATSRRVEDTARERVPDRLRPGMAGPDPGPLRQERALPAQNRSCRGDRFPHRVFCSGRSLGTSPVRRAGDVNHSGVPLSPPDVGDSNQWRGPPSDTTLAVQTSGPRKKCWGQCKPPSLVELHLQNFSRLEPDDYARPGRAVGGCNMGCSPGLIGPGSRRVRLGWPNQTLCAIVTSWRAF